MITAWYFTLTLVFAPGVEQQLEIEKQTEIACNMAIRALQDSIVVGKRSLPPTRLEYGVSEKCTQREPRAR